jgi:hypothetical protein
MTYIALTLNKKGIVVAADSRAHYFTDYIEEGKIKGKLIEFFWDGNRKLFIIKRKLIIACQGLLFWGDSRLLLQKHIKNFEQQLSETDIEKTARQLHNYFKVRKRKNSSEFEVMHFLVAGLKNNKPLGFYVNTYYDQEEGVKSLPYNDNKTFYINGDGKGKFIGRVLSIKEAKNFCKGEVLKRHKKAPYDVGDEVDVAVLSLKNKIPYFAEHNNSTVTYDTLGDLMQAIQSQKLAVKKLIKPKVLLYK